MVARAAAKERRTRSADRKESSKAADEDYRTDKRVASRVPARSAAASLGSVEHWAAEAAEET